MSQQPPNREPAARKSGKPGKLRHVALIVESQVAPRRMMLTGVARYIQEHEPWAVYLKPYGVEKSLPQWLRDWNGDGIIAAVNDPDIAQVTQRGVPIVDIMGALRPEGVPLVHTNDESVGRLGAEHLMERGFSTYAFCEYIGQFWSEARREGFRAALRERGHDCLIYSLPLPASIGGPEMWEQQQRDFAAWIAALPKPVGVMTTNDLMGQQLLEACLRLRINVPEEVAVVGADNDEPICRIASPPLSSVIINDHQRGYEAAALLDRMMRGQPPPVEPIYVEPVGVMARASTDIMAIEDAAVVKALRFLRDRAYEPIGVDDVVREVPVSRSVLERRFRKAVGRSINNEIVRLRINRAIELLTDTQLEMKVIARKAGFGTQSYMNAVFQAKLGKTPGSYRRQRV
ncbi:MAG: XylR family transcriptional regulator [Phycisphaerae bacterium]|nr:XylR family transcriptional regulator [Phycisphaerae bacterium]MDW8261579.1 XylR family transcriptional regulator [Phycisphaerales bacterium]